MSSISRRERPPSGQINRRERPPSGQVNRPKTAGPVPSARMLFSARKDASTEFPETMSEKISTERKETYSRPETDRSQLSTNEVLRRMREKSERKKKQEDFNEISALGPYNAFSRPRSSMIAPLRTVLLDPSINNFPKSKTRTELMRRIRTTGMPHPSYDLDNDGYVSQQDFKLAKRFDFDGNGVLDPDERQVGRRVLADEFFKRHANDLHNFGPSFENNTHKQNVEKLLNSYSFERSYDRLISVERTLKAESSKPILDCIRNDNDEKFQRHKYFTDKFDSTAWTDFERVPRASWLGTTTDLDEHNHGGSRKRLLLTRREKLRNETSEKLLVMEALHRPKSGSPMRRINLISDVRVENS